MAISLKPIQRARMRFGIVGTTPLIQHKWAEKAKQEMRDKQQEGKKTKTRDKRGAWAIQVAVAEIGEPHVSEDEGCEHLDKLAAECREFKSQMMREYGEMN